ncbi:MAG TPA: ribulose-phosphate 3-epimerase [Alphaproteobacteria bacterium]|nr:ribulose-phosphate 3-epimerase [Alphaproteobacteria bacterium]
MARISASILSFLFNARLNKIRDSEMINHINSALHDKKSKYQILHIDIEDGKFVSHKAFTPAQLLKINSPHKAEAHLMVVNYDKYIRDYFHSASMFIVHNEVIKRNFPKTIEFLRKNKKFIGIAINPETHIDEIKYIDKVDLILVMSVHPGLPGQEFLEHSLNKVKKLQELRKKHKYKYLIEIDGGVNNTNAKKCIDAGADILVMGSYLFK